MRVEQIAVRPGFVDDLERYIQDMPYAWAAPLMQEVIGIRSLNQANSVAPSDEPITDLTQ